MDIVVSVVVDMFNVCILQERKSSKRLEPNLGFHEALGFSSTLDL